MILDDVDLRKEASMHLDTSIKKVFQETYETDFSNYSAMGRQDLHALLLADLNIVQYLNGLLVKHTLLRRVICATTSRSRLKDISIALWIVFSLSAAASGFPYLWTAVINAIVALSAQYMLSCRRPLDFVAPLCDTKRTDPDTFGFPCIDTHLSVIVLLPIITNASNLPYRICAAILLLYIPITRILTASRFVYQIIGSVSTGLLCAFLGRTLQPYSKFVPISSTFQ
ncbi:unnamed protein product [Albugo candida]|uniref:Phosphatidic acid phosphatase type 2/haloperoxidase domain-containing protein n=1 Tax=Albugo candida TaxID=65357 RepID=A0A024G193_9STRA|nr:unnamed protein product [Albugo candida]|eukprot:CCI40395.1 unnamed protein product [Albugo candida]